MPRPVFGTVLALVFLLYLWLAWNTISPGVQSGDWVSYLGAVLFILAAVGAVGAGVNLLKPKRR